MNETQQEIIGFAILFALMIAGFAVLGYFAGFVL